MLNPKKTKKHRQYLRNNMTKWEICLWNELKNKKMFGFKVRRQYGVKNYVIDFYCPKLKLAIEVDGDVHYFKDKKVKDEQKNQALKERGIFLIRIKNSDLEDDYESMIKFLEDLFLKRAKEYKCDIKDME